MTDLTEVRVPVTTLKRVCGDDGGEIAKLIQTRQIVIKDGTAPLAPSVRAYLDAIRSEARNASLTAARDEAREARAEAAELGLLLDERQLIPEQDADDALAVMTGAVIWEIHTIPARSTRDMSQRVVIEAALHDMQSELAADFLAQSEEPASTRKRKGETT